MTSALFIYGTVLGLFLAISAHFLDGALRALGRPTRWIWMAALSGTALVPFLLPFLPRASATAGVLGVVIPVEALFQMSWESLPAAAGGGALLGPLDHALITAWVVASGTLLLVVVGGAWKLYREAAGWAQTRAGDEEVLVSGGLGPAVLGFLNPRIILPPWVLSLSPEDLEMILLHEGEHRRARDPALLAGGILMAILAPWNVPLWWSLSRLRLAVEGDCDGRVLARGIGRERYGALLLDMASNPRGYFPLAPALTEGGSTFLERRLQMMRNHVRGNNLRGAVAGVVAGGFFLLLACETPTPPIAEEAATATFQAAISANEAEAQVGEGEGGGGRFIFSESVGSASGDEVKAEGPVSIRLTGGAEGAAPLVYLDGVLQDGGYEAVKALNPDEIERIEVIKGAAAQALLGSEAANGVIKIFLKK